MLKCNFAIFGLFFLLPSFALSQHKVILYPAPPGEILSARYSITVEGRYLPVYTCKIGMADNINRFKAVDDLLHSEKYYDMASFAYFDMRGQASVTVNVKDTVNSVKILPASANIKVTRHLHSITFLVTQPQNLTVEINGEWIKSLHLFVNPVASSIPDAHDPDVLFFGPGIHELSSTVIGDHHTIYVAGGAILKCVIGKNEPFGIEPSGLRNYAPRILLAGRQVKLCGRGIIDAGDCPVHAGNFIVLKGSDLTLEGVIIRNSCGWTVPVRQSDHVVIDNVKILGYRANSDGIDICNSTNVMVKNCFIRTNDDLIVVKTEKGEGPAKHILVNNCVLFNQLANALSLGAELREDVDDVCFTNCHIIHDQGRAWSLRIFQSDSSTISHIRFEDLDIAESHLFVSLWIGKEIASYNKALGNIRDVLFRNIDVHGAPLNIDLVGGDKDHDIQNVTFQHIILNDKNLWKENVKSNLFVKDVVIKSD